MKVSFCITCMDRLRHLQLTLRKNMEDNPDGEFVLVDYSSKEPVRQWITKEFAPALESGTLIFVEALQEPYYRSPHAKNLAHVWSTGEVVCNLDADNLLGKGFAKLLSAIFQHDRSAVCCSPHMHTEARNGTHGRIALSRGKFLSLGGYDEGLDWGWGWDDYDLINRAVADRCLKYTLPDECMETISHGDDLRVVNMNFDKLKTLDHYMVLKLQEVLPAFTVENMHHYSQKHLSVLIHQIVSKYNIDKKQLTANKGKRWAEALVTSSNQTCQCWMTGREFKKALYCPSTETAP